MSEPATVAETRAASFTSKTGWRNRNARRAKPELPVQDSDEDAADAPSEDAVEAPLDPAAEDGLVLEQEPDDGTDMADLGVKRIDTKDS